MSGTAEAPRAPGRPRSADADTAIMRATLELLVEEGFRGLSVEAVRQRAGVGKATIYRRFADKEALVRATMALMHAQLELPDTGTLRGDLESAWSQAYELAAGARERLMVARLLVDAAHDPDLFALFRETLVERRRGAMLAMIGRAVDRGELRPGLDPELIVDLLAGPMIYRVLIDAGDVPDPVGRAMRVYDTLVEGIGS